MYMSAHLGNPESGHARKGSEVNKGLWHGQSPQSAAPAAPKNRTVNFRSSSFALMRAPGRRVS